MSDTRLLFSSSDTLKHSPFVTQCHNIRKAKDITKCGFFLDILCVIKYQLSNYFEGLKVDLCMMGLCTIVSNKRQFQASYQYLFIEYLYEIRSNFIYVDRERLMILLR